MVLFQTRSISVKTFQLILIFKTFQNVLRGVIRDLVCQMQPYIVGKLI